MTPDIEQLCREALEDAAKATPGPWRQGNVETYHVFCPYAGALAPELGRVLLRMNTHFEHEADTAFIAAARTREPLLAKALLAERKETERLREWEQANAPLTLADITHPGMSWTHDDAVDRLRNERDTLRAEVDRLRRRPPMGCSTCEDHNQTLHEENMRLEHENAELRKAISEDKALLLESRNGLRNWMHEVIDELMFADDDGVNLHIEYGEVVAMVRDLIEKRRNAEVRLADAQMLAHEAFLAGHARPVANEMVNDAFDQWWSDRRP